LWFSQNDNLNRTAGADIQSPTVKSLTISAAVSYDSNLCLYLVYITIAFIVECPFYNVNTSILLHHSCHRTH